METRSCRLCGGAADYKHCVALFSPLNTKNDLVGRMSSMLEVPIHQNDGRPTVICRRCMSKFTAVERDLKALKQKALVSYDSFDKENESRKRAKSTSGSVVSPFTASVRPPAKRIDRCRLFPNSKSWQHAIICTQCHYDLNFDR